MTQNPGAVFRLNTGGFDGIRDRQPRADRAVQLAAGHLHFYGGFRHSFIAEHDDRYTQCHIDNAYDRHLPAVEEQHYQIKQGNEDVQEGFRKVACQKIIHIFVVLNSGDQIAGIALVKKGDGQLEHVRQEFCAGNGTHDAFQLL